MFYEGGLRSKRKYTSVRNSSDIVKQAENGLLRNLKTEIMQGCEIPKIIPYKTLMTHIKNIEIGEVLGLEILAENFSTEAVPGVYRPLKVQLTPNFFFRKTKTSNYHDTFGEKISVIDEILAILQLFKVEVPLSHDRAFVGSGMSLSVTSSKESLCYVLQSIEALFGNCSRAALHNIN